MANKALLVHSILQNRLAAICLAVITLLMMLALMAYMISPDSTTDANHQIPQLSLQPPMTKVDIVKVKKNIFYAERSILNKWIYGHDDSEELIPYDSVSWQKRELIISFQASEQRMDYADILYSSNGENNLTSAELMQRVKKTALGQKTYWLGSDKYCRDTLSRLILGLRASLIIGFLAVIVSLLIGITIGSIAGYYGGWIDHVLMLLINTAWSIPTLLMAFAIILAFGKGFSVIVLSVGLTMWVDVARIVRGQVMQVKQELFVQATKLMGLPSRITIREHILPNILGPILVIAAANFATAVLVEAGLSYLGIGIQPPAPSLGNMLKESYAYAAGGYVYLVIFPIIMIMTLVLVFNLLGTALRDVFDIKTVK